MSTAVQPDTDTLPTPEGTTVFRAFERDEFLAWPAWKRLEKILKANGGSYGLAGPRGAGKSWLMLQAIECTQDPEDQTHVRGIGLWYPSPSEYDPLAFIASLSDSLASRIDWWYRHNDAVKARTVYLRMVLLCAFALGAVAGALGGAIGGLSPWVCVLMAAVAGLAATLVAWLGFRTWRSFQPEDALLRDAKLVREHARYTATRRESTELGGQAGRAGVLARARQVRERQLVERPATLSSLVGDFRWLAEETGRVTGRLVIAIDELDKMSDPDKVRALLRDIKAIFEVPRVHFLVSVSDEAARNLSLGGLSDRNEFNSSFYTVVEALPATPQDCAELLEQRGNVPREVSLVLAVLAGGNPREVVRLAELTGAVTTGREAAMLALREEALGLRRQIVTAENTRGRRPLGHEAREAAFLALPDAAFEQIDRFADLCHRVLEPELWDPPWKDAGWSEQFEEAWRRLMIRLAVGGRLADSDAIVSDKDFTRQLRDVITAAGQSAQVAKVVLDRKLRVEGRRPSLIDESDTDVRQQFDEIARRYESTRADMDSGPDRTRAMEKIAQEARRLASESPYSTDDLLSLLRSERPGDRVIALAIVQGTADPATFPDVFGAIREPKEEFEQRQALRALESLRPGLDPSQRKEVESTLKNKSWRATLPAGGVRQRLADRMLKGLEHDHGPPA
jgi:KAP-like P-loop domain-containing protein